MAKGGTSTYAMNTHAQRLVPDISSCVDTHIPFAVETTGTPLGNRARYRSTKLGVCWAGMAWTMTDASATASSKSVVAVISGDSSYVAKRLLFLWRLLMLDA